MELSQRRRHVGHMLEHLHAERTVEALFRECKRGGASLLECGVTQPFAAARRGLEHCAAGVDADHGATGTGLREELSRVEARAAADVQPT